MATGVLDPFLEQFERGGQGSFELAPLPQDERLLTHGSSLDSGALTGINSDPISQSYGGHRQFSFLDDFYFRIYLIPQVLDFGAIVTNTTRSVSVWNAYFTPVNLLSITPTVGDEVTVGGPALPNHIAALTLRAWQFSVTPEGPPALDESFVWTFDNGDTFTLPVEGTRSVLWPFLPNWESPFEVNLEYDTSILTARSGREQRIAERAEPRASLEFSVTVHSAQRKKYRELMAYWQDRPFIVSDVSRNVSTETPMIAGATSVVVEDFQSWLDQEDRAVVLVSGSGPNRQIGLRVIDNLDDSGNVLTFKDVDETDWPASTKIYAGVVANLEDERGLTRHTTNVISGSIKFNILPGTELVEEAPAAPFVFNDKELFLYKPNWGNEVENVDRHQTEYVNYGVGRIARFSHLAWATQAWTQNFVGRDADGIRELLDVFKRMKGRQGEFYMPTWEQDITAKTTLNINDLGLRVEGLDTFTAYADDATTRALMVQLWDGTRIFRAIEEITDIDDPDGHDTLVNVTEVWTANIEPEDIEMICWVRTWRFAADDLTAQFLTNTVAQLQMSMQTLEDLPAESDEDSNSP